ESRKNHDGLSLLMRAGRKIRLPMNSAGISAALPPKANRTGAGVCGTEDAPLCAHGAGSAADPTMTERMGIAPTIRLRFIFLPSAPAAAQQQIVRSWPRCKVPFARKDANICRFCAGGRQLSARVHHLNSERMEAPILRRDNSKDILMPQRRSDLAIDRREFFGRCRAVRGAACTCCERKQSSVRFCKTEGITQPPVLFLLFPPGGPPLPRGFFSSPPCPAERAPRP